MNGRYYTHIERGILEIYIIDIDLKINVLQVLCFFNVRIFNRSFASYAWERTNTVGWVVVFLATQHNN